MIAGCALPPLGDMANPTWRPTLPRRQHGVDAKHTGYAFSLLATVADALGPLLGGLAGGAIYLRRRTAGRLWLCAAAARLCTPLLAAYGGKDGRWLIALLVGNGLLSVLTLALGTGLASAATQLLAAAAPTVVAFVSAQLPAAPGRSAWPSAS